MPIKKIGSPHPKYLAATDILISDMSNINYDFLLFDRPIILLANEWLRNNFPDIGIKTELEGLEDSIKRAIEYPMEYHEQRKYWHERTMFRPDGHSSERVIDTIIKRSGFKEPFFLFIHGNNEVSKVHLYPIVEIVKKKKKQFEFTGFFNEKKYRTLREIICISTHNNILAEINAGFRVHLDHSVKGEGVTDYNKLALQYKNLKYYPNTDLHITEGEISYENTKKLLGPYKNRAVKVGYPKSDILLKCDTEKNKKEVYRELGFKEDKILITYAPTGKYRFPFKQGASLSTEVLDRLKMISKRFDYNILVKLRSSYPLPLKVFNFIRTIKRNLKK
jgi:CDP-glycerol glycerophosphotransferase (TagB/SpsB family)